MFDINKAIRDENAYRLDPEGALADLDEWSEEIAGRLATEEGITLTGDHWAVLCYLRDYYRAHDGRGDAREALCCLEDAFVQQGGRKYLFHLFPGGPVYQGGRIAGLPALPHSHDLSFGSVH